MSIRDKKWNLKKHQWFSISYSLTRYYYYYYYHHNQHHHHHHHHYLLTAMSCHSVAVVLTIVQTKQIRINIHKRNNTKNAVQTIQNTVHTSTYITKTPSHTYTVTHYKTSSNNHSFKTHIKSNSHSTIK